MADPRILVPCLAGLFCFAPLALYLLWLAALTRRDRPTVITGPWDFAGLVLGLSGFVLFGGGVVLFLLQSNFRYLMRGNVESLRAVWGQEKYTWMLLAGLYLLMVLGWLLLVILARRRSLVVYNVDPASFESSLTEVFEQLNRHVERRGKQWVSDRPLLELDRFQAGQTVTLRWLSDDLVLFQEVDRLLREALSTTISDENPATQWLLTGAVGAGVAVLFALVLMVVATIYR